MREFPPVTSLSDLGHLDMAEVIAGYHCGLWNCHPPTSAHSRAYWHGYMNGRVDGGHATESPDQTALRQLIRANAQEAPQWLI